MGFVLIAALWTALGAEPAEARAQAAAHFQQAERFFNEGRYEESVREFEAANVLGPHPDLLFNLGKCHERLGDLAEALSYYRSYVKAVPEAEDAGLVRVAIADLERQQRERGTDSALAAVAGDAPRALAVVPGTTSTPGGRTWTWVLAGAAGAGLATGVGLGFGAQTARDEMVRERHAAPEVQQLHDAALGRATGANFAYATAGAAALTAFILFFLEPTSPSKGAR